MRIILVLVCLAFSSYVAAIDIISHRANSCGALENTFESIEDSWAIGVDAIELDVRVSKDSIAYLFHDGKIGNVRIKGKTYKEVLVLAPDHEINTLVEALTLNSSSGYYILDLKDIAPTNISALIDAISKSQISETKLVFQSDDIELLSMIHSNYPSSRYFFLERLSRKAPLFQKPEPAEIVKLIEGDVIDGLSLKGRSFLNESYLAQFKQSGIEIYVWTINDPERAHFYETIGVTGIITDNFLSVQQALKSRPSSKLGCE